MLIDEMLGQFEPFELPPVAVVWDVERESPDWASLRPVTAPAAEVLHGS